MAAPHVFVTWTVQDAKGKTSVTKVNFPDSTDIAILKMFASSTIGLLDPLMKGRIIEAGIGLSVDISAATRKAAPLPDSDVEEGARFQWNTVSGAVTGFRVPTFDEAKLVTGTRNVNTADAQVAAFVNRITDGQTQGLINVSPSDDRGSDINALKSARESFTSSRGE